MRQAGRYLPEYRAVRASAGGFLDLCYTPSLAVEVTLQPLRRYGFDAAILFSDILVVADGLGQDVSFKEGEGPVLVPVRTEAAIEALDPGRVTGHLAPVYETVRRLSLDIPADTALIGFAGAPWTLATYMVEGGGSKDFATVKAMAYGRRALFGRLMDKITIATADHLLAQIASGAEAVQLFDSWAGVLPEDAFHEWVIAPTRTLVERIRAAHPEIPIIGFPRGAGLLYEIYARETGVDCVGLDTTVPVAWAAERLQPICAVQGNLDPILVVAGGAAMDAAIARIVSTLRHGPFVFNLGHGIVPGTPPEHVAALMARIRGEVG